MKVVLLTNDSIQANALKNELIRHGIPLVAMLTEKKNKVQSPNSRIKKILKPIFDLIRYNSTTLKAINFEKRCEHLAKIELQRFIDGLPKLNHDIPQITIESVNSVECRNQLMKIEPDIVVVYGTGIIKKDTLKLAKNCFVNVHSSILPFFRGTRSEFWQCYFEDFQHVGISIHRVDQGVDTGEIYAQFRQQIPDNPNPYNLRTGNNILMLKYYPEVIHKIMNDDLEIVPNELMEGQRTYRMSDITFEKRIQLYQRLMK